MKINLNSASFAGAMTVYSPRTSPVTYDQPDRQGTYRIVGNGETVMFFRLTKRARLDLFLCAVRREAAGRGFFRRAWSALCLRRSPFVDIEFGKIVMGEDALVGRPPNAPPFFDLTRSEGTVEMNLGDGTEISNWRRIGG